MVSFQTHKCVTRPQWVKLPKGISYLALTGELWGVFVIIRGRGGLKGALLCCEDVWRYKIVMPPVQMFLFVELDCRLQSWFISWTRDQSRQSLYSKSEVKVASPCIQSQRSRSLVLVFEVRGQSRQSLYSESEVNVASPCIQSQRSESPSRQSLYSNQVLQSKCSCSWNWTVDLSHNLSREPEVKVASPCIQSQRSKSPVLVFRVRGQSRQSWYSKA